MCRYWRDYTLHGHILKGCIALLVLSTALHYSAEQAEPWLTDLDALAEIAAQDDLLRRLADEEFEQATHHREMPDTMYASTPTSTPIANSLTCPVRHEDENGQRVAASARRNSLRSHESSNPGFSPELPEHWEIGESSSQVRERNEYDGMSEGLAQGTHPSVSASHALLGGNSSRVDFAGLNLEPLHVPLVIAGTERDFDSLVRLTNRSSIAGSIQIVAIDDIGQRKDPIWVAINANDTIQISTSDLELGNPELGIDRGIGLGVGNWRLEVTSNLAFATSAFVRTFDGLLVSMHDTVRREGRGYHVSTFYPATEPNRTSRLRLTNPGKSIAQIAIQARTEQGAANGSVSLELMPGASTFVDSNELENGSIAVTGSFQHYAGVRQLWIDSNVPIEVMNLVASESGHLANISTEIHLPPHENSVFTLFSSLNETSQRSSLIRFINSSNELGYVNLNITDEGTYPYEAIQFELQGNSTLQLNARDIETGNPRLGLDEGLGYGIGDWRIRVDSELDLRVATLIQSEDGFVSSVHELEFDGAHSPNMVFWDWGSFSRLENRLVLTNPNAQTVFVEVTGMGRTGEFVSDVLRFQIEPGQARQLTRFDLATNQLGVPNSVDYEIEDWQLQIRSDRPLMVRNLIEGLDGRISVLSPTPLVQAAVVNNQDSSDSIDVADFFSEHIYDQIVQERCINCHREGQASGHTRLVFVSTGNAEADEAANLQVIRDFLSEVENGKQRILDKMQGIGHGGGTQFLSNTQEYKDMSEFLGLLEDEDEEPKEPTVTEDTLLQHVALESDRRTLWRAALILAGRIPTEVEYALLETDDDGLRSAVRGLMQGHAFHEFLIRSANDRLLTDRDKRVFDENTGLFVNYTNTYYQLYKEAVESGPRRGNIGDYRKLDTWYQRTQFGVRREGLELIAHVVENDLPYTEILTADYLLTNPYAGKIYDPIPDDLTTEFDDSADPFDFQISDVISYYRRCSGRSFSRDEFGLQIKTPGSCPTDLPFAGVLTNKTFLLRYPTTATNRNRARSRWTYYHFLDVDIENSASRTTDPVALADTNNPTMKNGACTVCHAILDPVAGAFQDYGEEGDYWDEHRGQDSLDYNYVISNTLPRLNVNERTYEEREIVSVTENLTAGVTEVQLAVVYDRGNKWSEIGIDYLALKNEYGDEVAKYEIEDLDGVANDNCGTDLLDAETQTAYAYKLTGRASYGRREKCSVVVDVAVPNNGTYTLDASVWIVSQSNDAEGEAAQLVISPEAFYRKGDTWYRDMREPGFGNALAPGDQSSIQWLAQQMAADDRFATSAVKFWWPAIMGTDVPVLPTNTNLPDYDSIILGITAQHATVSNLAQSFQQGFGEGEPYNLRDLLTEMIVSPWFRGEGTLESAGSTGGASFENVGARRLLTPEELARKTANLTGFQWGRVHDESRWRWVEDYQTNALDAEYLYRLLYGGIDSDGIVDRARDMTAVMAGVAKTHAVEVSCPVIMRELYLLEDEDRYLFSGLDKWTSPSFEFGSKFEITGDSSENTQTISISGQMPVGGGTLVVAFLNDFYQASDQIDRNIQVDTIRIKNSAGETISTFDLVEDDITFVTATECNNNTDGLIQFNCEGTVEIPISIATEGTYTVEADLWADQGGDEEPLFFMSANSTHEDSAGSKTIKSKLADLHGKLLGSEVDVDSIEIQDRYDLLVDSWQRNRSIGATFNSGRYCNHWSDYRFLEGVVEDPVLEVFEEKRGTYYVRNNEAWNELNQTVDWSDPTGIASTWVVVLTSYLMDFDYLHL